MRCAVVGCPRPADLTEITVPKETRIPASIYEHPAGWRSQRGTARLELPLCHDDRTEIERA
jgi:hypothetical protein